MIERVYVIYKSVGGEVKVKLTDVVVGNNLTRIENIRTSLGTCACNNSQRRNLENEARTILAELPVAQQPFDGALKTVQLKWSYS